MLLKHVATGRNAGLSTIVSDAKVYAPMQSNHMIYNYIFFNKKI